MLKYLPILLVAGCATAPTIDISRVYAPEAKLLAVLEQEPMGGNYTIEQCMNQPYVDDKGEDWKTPSRFMREGGDCEDYAICILYATNGEALLVGSDGHMWAEYEDTAYDQKEIYDAMGHRAGRQALYVMNHKFTAGLK